MERSNDGTFLHGMLVHHHNDRLYKTNNGKHVGIELLWNRLQVHLVPLSWPNPSPHQTQTQGRRSPERSQNNAVFAKQVRLFSLDIFIYITANGWVFMVWCCRVKAPIELRKKILASVATKQKLENSYYVAGTSRGQLSTTTTTTTAATADQQATTNTTAQAGKRQDDDDDAEDAEDVERPSFDEILEIKPVAVNPESLELNYQKAAGVGGGVQDGIERTMMTTTTTTRVVDSTAVNLGNLKRRRKRKRVQFGEEGDDDAAAA